MNSPSTPAFSYARARVIASSIPVRLGALVRPMIDSAVSSRAASAARILPTPSSSGISVGLASPKRRGSAVSSIVSAATPAVSSSCTVRMTLSALP